VYKISVRSTFSASHELKGYRGDCARIHGHNWGVTVVVSVRDVDELGMGIDFRVLRECLDKIVKELDHSHLNDLEAFREINPTAEYIAKYLYRWMISELPDGTRIEEVRVEETDQDWASYHE
jgi:6-pyruvoyltetrahydropterin/6-carboxytetrahydropterin synthase